MKCDICGQSWTNSGMFGREHKCDPNTLDRRLGPAVCPKCGIIREGIGHDLSVRPYECHNNEKNPEEKGIAAPVVRATLTPSPEKLNTIAECLASIVMGRLGIPIEHKKTTTMEDRIFIEQLMLRELTAAYADGKASR